MKKLIAITVICFLSLSSIAQAKSSEIFTVNSIEVGDYCWATGFLSNGTTKKKETFLLNTDASKKICQSGDSQQETKQWQGKKWKIKTKSMEICEHIPPCDQGDKTKMVKGIFDFEEVK